MILVTKTSDQARQCVCACVNKNVKTFRLDNRLQIFWTSGFLDVPAGVAQEEGHTGFLIHLPSAVLALLFLARRI